VLDFLDPKVVSQVTTKAARGKGKSASSGTSHFAVDETGRMVFEEEDRKPKQGATGMSSASGETPEDYYRESLTGEGAFQRLPDGRIKFLKRKRGDEDEAMEDGFDEDDKPLVSSKFGIRNKQPKKSGLDEATKNKMLGKQFKAKVSLHSLA
jgi:hypothetical protein